VTRSERLPAEAWLPLLRDALTREGRFCLPLRGNSMLPTLPTECEIDVVPISDAPAAGQLVVFALGDALVAHRIVRRDGERWIAQGDNRRVADPPLAPGQVLGRVVAAHAGGRRVWPGPAESALARWWVARAWALRGARWAAWKARGE
jgi:hypothetical protein